MDYLSQMDNQKMEIRKVSSKAQITLPKEFSGKLVSIEKLADGVIQIKTGEFIPDSEKMFHTRSYQNQLERFDQWMDHHVLEETGRHASTYDQLKREAPFETHRPDSMPE